MVRMLSWNLQNFGTRYGTDAAAKTCEIFRVHMVSMFVAQAEAAVLVIQELRKEGVGYLRNFRDELNKIARSNKEAADWNYDWLPGSIAGTNEVASLADLAFTPVGNSEGYGVLYRTGHLAQMESVSAGENTSALDGGIKANFISLIYKGRPVIFQDDGDFITITYREGRNYVPLNFIRSCCTDPNLSKSMRSGKLKTNEILQQRALVRRPCVVHWSEPNSAEEALPVVVYHAPVGARGAKSPLYGTLIGFASDALQGDDAIYTGDLNVVTFNCLDAISQHARDSLEYAYQSQSAGVFSNSMVHASTRGGTSWRLGDGIYTTSRDLAFAKKTQRVSVENVIPSIETAGAEISDYLKARADFITKKVIPRAARFVKNPPGAEELVAAYVAGQVPAGATYDLSTCCALIYNLVFSDHLPILLDR